MTCHACKNVANPGRFWFLSCQWILLLLFQIGLGLDASDYYVDYAAGGDTLSGLSPSQAWKHAPGDPQAGSIPASIILQPGDRVLFKGGVHYRGQVAVAHSGSTGQAIVFKGDAWPGLTGVMAIIDGSDVVTASWTRCQNAGEVGGNANWSSIWWADLPQRNDACSANLISNERLLYVAQWPHPEGYDPFFNDAFRHYAQTDSLTRTSLQDARLAELGGPALVGKTLFVYHIPNIVSTRKILSYQNQSISYDDLGNDPYSSNDQKRYALANHAPFIDRPGEYVYDENPGELRRTFLWPLGEDPNLECITISLRNWGVNLSGRHDLVVEGFIFQNHSGWNGPRDGIGVGCAGTASCADLILRNCVSRHNRYAAYNGYGGFYFTNVTGLLVENNLIEANPRHNGILVMNGSQVTLKNNRIIQNGNKGIWVMNSSRVVLEGNRIEDCDGTHATAISIFGTNSSNLCRDVLLIRNRVRTSNQPLTMQWCENISVLGNLFDGDKEHNGLVSHTGDNLSGQNTLINNTILHSGSSYSVMLNHDDWRIYNNIVDGMGGMPTAGNEALRSHNLYIGVAWNQHASYGWRPLTGELIRQSGSQYLPVPAGEVWIDPESDQHLLDTSPARDAGMDPSVWFPTQVFTEIDFFRDIDGKACPYGEIWDMGALQFGTSPTLIILTPNGGEMWRRGEQRTISWTSSGVTGDLTIELLQGATVLGIIAENVSVASGSYIWTVGHLANGGPVSGNDLKVRIRYQNGSSMARIAE